MEKDYPFAGFGVGGYRCFAFDSPGSFGPFGKIHILAGQNNSGKSALLQCTVATLNALQNGAQLSFDSYPFSRDDVPHGYYDGMAPTTKLSFCFTLESLMSNEKIACCPEFDQQRVRDVLGSDKLCKGDEGYVWIDFTAPTIDSGKYGGRALTIDTSSLIGIGKGIRLGEISSRLTSHSSGKDEDNVASIISTLVPWDAIPKAVIVEAIREVSVPAGEDSQDKISSGYDLPKRLLRLSNPMPAAQHVAAERWDRFIAFVRDIPLTFASLIGYSIMLRVSNPYTSTIASAVVGPKPLIRPLDKNFLIPSNLDGGKMQMSSATT